MSITDILSAEDIAAALQECQGDRGLEEQAMVALGQKESEFQGSLDSGVRSCLRIKTRGCSCSSVDDKVSAQHK